MTIIKRREGSEQAVQFCGVLRTRKLKYVVALQKYFDLRKTFVEEAFVEDSVKYPLVFQSYGLGIDWTVIISELTAAKKMETRVQTPFTFLEQKLAQGKCVELDIARCEVKVEDVKEEVTFGLCRPPGFDFQAAYAAMVIAASEEYNKKKWQKTLDRESRDNVRCSIDVDALNNLPILGEEALEMKGETPLRGVDYAEKLYTSYQALKHNKQDLSKDRETIINNHFDLYVRASHGINMKKRPKNYGVSDNGIVKLVNLGTVKMMPALTPTVVQVKKFLQNSRKFRGEDKAGASAFSNHYSTGVFMGKELIDKIDRLAFIRNLNIIPETIQERPSKDENGEPEKEKVRTSVFVKGLGPGEINFLAMNLPDDAVYYFETDSFRPKGCRDNVFYVTGIEKVKYVSVFLDFKVQHVVRTKGLSQVDYVRQVSQTIKDEFLALQDSMPDVAHYIKGATFDMLPENGDIPFVIGILPHNATVLVIRTVKNKCECMKPVELDYWDYVRMIVSSNVVRNDFLLDPRGIGKQLEKLGLRTKFKIWADCTSVDKTEEWIEEEGEILMPFTTPEYHSALLPSESNTTTSSSSVVRDVSEKLSMMADMEAKLRALSVENELLRKKKRPVSPPDDDSSPFA